MRTSKHLPKTADAPAIDRYSLPMSLSRLIWCALIGLFRSRAALEAEILSFDTNSTCRAHSVLIVIETNPGRSRAAIGRALNIERARLARLLHELERRNWVLRRASASDGRSHSLFLTSAGEKALARIKSLAERHEAQTAEFVEPRRRMLLMGSVERFRPTHRVTTLGGTTAVIAVRDFRCWQMLSKRICGGSPEQH